jgi:6-phosphofructokinase
LLQTHKFVRPSEPRGHQVADQESDASAAFLLARSIRKAGGESGVTTTITDVTSHVTKNLELLKLNHLIAIGGDDTLSYGAKLDKLGVKVIAIPKTMDNDVRNTECLAGAGLQSRIP